MTGKSLDRLILYSMNNADVISELIALLPEIQNLDYRTTGLLLQTATWYTIYFRRVVFYLKIFHVFMFYIRLFLAITNLIQH